MPVLYSVVSLHRCLHPCPPHKRQSHTSFWDPRSRGHQYPHVGQHQHPYPLHKGIHFLSFYVCLVPLYVGALPHPPQPHRFWISGNFIRGVRRPTHLNPLLLHKSVYEGNYPPPLLQRHSCFTVNGVPHPSHVMGGFSKGRLIFHLKASLTSTM